MPLSIQIQKASARRFAVGQNKEAPRVKKKKNVARLKEQIAKEKKKVRKICQMLTTYFSVMIV